jgi:hypothetical protein
MAKNGRTKPGTLLLMDAHSKTQTRSNNQRFSKQTDYS